jgi:hypothetical protein
MREWNDVTSLCSTAEACGEGERDRAGAYLNFTSTTTLWSIDLFDHSHWVTWSERLY